MTDSHLIEQEDTDPGQAPRPFGDSPLGSTPVLVAVGVVVLALIVGAFLLGRSSDTTDTAQGSPPESSQSQPAGDPLSQAIALHNAGRLDEALVIYQDLLSAEPGNQYAAYNIGLINQTRGDNEAALEFYDRALAADPTLSVAVYNRALALRDVGRIDESLAAFESLLAEDGDNVGVLYNYGNLLISQGEVERGVELVNRAIELNPSLRGD